MPKRNARLRPPHGIGGPSAHRQARLGRDEPRQGDAAGCRALALVAARDSGSSKPRTGDDRRSLWFRGKGGICPRGVKPRIEKFPERSHERFLTSDELARLGDVLRQGETVGLPYAIDENSPKAKHAPKEDNRRVMLDPFAVAAGAIRPCDRPATRGALRPTRAFSIRAGIGV
jgi:hypothetical protein